MDKKDLAKDLINFIDSSPCMYFAVKNMSERLKENGFTELREDEEWKIEKSKGYYLVKNSSTIIAFKTGEDLPSISGFKITGSHSDSPTFKIKPAADIYQNGYHKLNTEVYGGPIISSWFDRTLSVAGRVYTVNEDDPLKIHEHLINIDKDLFTIANLCIHQNRNVNKGYEYNAQKDTLPILELINENMEKTCIEDILAKELKIDRKSILDYELFIYDREKGKIIGLNDEFIHSSRLDNLAMAHVSLNALLSSEHNKAVNLIYVSDNEEVGSRTKQGADSPFLKNTLKRIVLSMENKEESFYRAIAKSFMISADLAHAYHPNYPEKCDISNTPVINKGVCIKYAANQSYTSDAYSASVFKSYAKRAGENVQNFLNRSDTPGGSTIGPINATHIDIRSVDIGNPILAMHSVRELGGVDDHFSLYKILKEFYK